MEATKENPILKVRLTSVDALRGFTMFWIIGGDQIMRALPKISDNAVFRFLDIQLRHSTEQVFRPSTPEGLTFYDVIFPLFLFIIGISAYFSYQNRLGKGDSKAKIFKHVFIRAAVLFALGLIYYGARDPELKWLGYYGVLQRLAIGYFFAMIITLNTSWRGQAIWAGGLLVFYIILTKFIPVPEGTMGSYWRSLVTDALGIKMAKLLTLSMIPTVSTALLGILAGQWMKRQINTTEKVKGLLLIGTGILAAGLLMSLWIPVVKGEWNSSYVLVTGGISFILLGGFYWLIDIRQYKKWAFFFVVIGLNPLTIYMLAQLINFRNIAVMISLGFIEYFGTAQELVLALLTTTLHWFLVYWLYRQKIFIKI
ncbi:MAG: acyltransferase family protein [Bacteroidales bacterium]